MENLFLYGASGADLDNCDSFLHSLNQQTGKQDAQDANNSGVYIPSPQGMLNTGIDPYAPQDNFDQMFVLDQNQWDYPSAHQQEAHYEQHQQLPVQHTPLSQERWSGPRSLPSPPIKSESDSSPPDDDAYIPDQPDIGVEASGIAKKGGNARQRKTKTSHNMIEKRYRNNINDKINMLRDSVPTLREAASTPLVDGIPSIRLNKATVLTKAAEYIEQLKSRNKMLQKENSELRARVSDNRRPQFHAPPPHGIVPVPPHDYYQQQQQRHQQQRHQQQQHHQQQQQQQHSQPHSHHHQQPHHQPPPRQAQHSLHQGQGRSTSANMALGCATAGLLTTGSVLSSGENNFRGLSALPLNSLYKLLGSPSESSIKLTIVAAACFLIGGMYVALLSRWSRNLGKMSSAQPGRIIDENTVRVNAMGRLGLPLQPSHLNSIARILRLVPQALFCLVFGNRSLEQLRVQFGFRVDTQLGYYLDRVIDADMSGNGSPPLARTVICFLMSFQTHTPNREMLQALQLKQLLARVHLDKVAAPLINRLWMRDNTSSPIHIRELAKIPLSAITEDFTTISASPNVTVTGRGLQVSEQAICTVTDPKVLSVLELVGCLYAITLQDRAMCKVLETGEDIDMEQLEICAKITPPDTTANLRSLCTEAMFTNDGARMDELISRLKAETNESSGHPCVPYLAACVMTRWFATRFGTYAETILPEFGSLRQFNSGLLYSCYYLALKSLAENGLGRSNLVQPALEVRAWLGSSDPSSAFGLSVSRRKELIHEVLGFANSFASREMDEACSIPDDVVEATLLEA